MTASESPRFPESRGKLLVLVGPTAVGKTELSLRLAERLNAEIVSGDSMQVYRGMDIGTAKATREERARVPHHLIDIRDPVEPFSVSDFQEEARGAIAAIRRRGRLPFVVGGTGLYIESLCYDYRFTEAEPDLAYRNEQMAYAASHGAEALHRRLAAVDPRSAERLHPNDTRRIIRALEIRHTTGVSLSEHLGRQDKKPLYDLCLIGLTMERARLYARIGQRVDQMVEEGLVEEVRGLLARGVSRDAVSMQGLGYKQIAGYLAGECSLETAVEILKRDTRRFAKRQLSWFRHMPDIRWVDAGGQENFSAKMETIHAIIAGKFRADRE